MKRENVLEVQIIKIFFNENNRIYKDVIQNKELQLQIQYIEGNNIY